MRRSILLQLIILLVSIGTSTPSRALTVTVPDDFPTIQLALDTQADTVRIRAGNYAERPKVGHDGQVTHLIEGIPELGVRPRIEGFLVSPCTELIVKGLSFTGSVDLLIGCSSVDRVIFDSCDLDSGLVHHPEPPDDLAAVTILRSRIRGPILLASRCEADTFESAGVTFDIRHSAFGIGNVFRGQGTTALKFEGLDLGDGYAIANDIEGFDVGISGSSNDYSVLVDGNRITGCDFGIRIGTESGDEVRNNTIINCRVGISAFVGNSLVLADNVVLGSTDEGIYLNVDTDADITATNNVVGRSGGDGIRADIRSDLFHPPAISLRNNTSYRNEGAGILIRDQGEPYEFVLRNNIGFENGTYGIDSDSMEVAGECNDWYGNQIGAVRGLLPSASDLSVDPLFCNVHIDSVALSAKSPVLDAAGCGLIGARGVGCSTTPTLVSLFTAERDAQGVRVRWRFAEPNRFAEVWVERTDAVAGPWQAIAIERATEGDLYVALDREASAERGYWYRLVARESGRPLVIGEPIAVEASAAGTFQLVRVSPNPGAGAQHFHFTLAHEAHVELDVFDVQGRHMASLVRGTLPAGIHDVEWNAQTKLGRAPGIHLVRYRHPGGEQTIRFVRLH